MRLRKDLGRVASLLKDFFWRKSQFSEKCSWFKLSNKELALSVVIKTDIEMNENTHYVSGWPTVPYASLG